MLFLWILLGILLFLFLLSMLSANVILEYRKTVTVTLSILCFKKILYPEKKKKIKISKQKQKAKKPTKKKPKPKEEPQEEGEILEKLQELRDLLVPLFKKTLGHLRIRTSRIRIHVATGDAATTAILFGAVNGGVVLLLEALDQFANVKTKRRDEIEVLPDYLAEKTVADIRLVFSLRVWQLLDILLKAFYSYIKSKNSKKTQEIS